MGLWFVANLFGDIGLDTFLLAWRAWSFETTQIRLAVQWKNGRKGVESLFLLAEVWWNLEDGSSYACRLSLSSVATPPPSPPPRLWFVANLLETLALTPFFWPEGPGHLKQLRFVWQCSEKWPERLWNHIYIYCTYALFLFYEILRCSCHLVRVGQYLYVASPQVSVAFVVASVRLIVDVVIMVNAIAKMYLGEAEQWNLLVDEVRLFLWRWHLSNP